MLEYQQVHRNTGNANQQLICNELRVLCRAAWFKADTQLVCISDTASAIREALGDECQDPSSDGFVMSATMANGDLEGDWDLKAILLGPSSGHEQCCRA